MNNVTSDSKKNSPKKSKIFDPFAGGRFLMSIAENQNITPDETLILLIIGSYQDFNDILHSKRYITIDRLVYLSKRSDRWVQKCLRSLEAKGYLLIEECYRNSGKQLASNYSLSDTIFEEAALKWKQSTGEYCSPHKVTEGEYCSPLGVNTVHPQIPNKEIPNNKKGNTKVLPKKEKTPRVQNKKWEKRQCQDMGIDVFTPDASNGYSHNPGRRCIELFMGEMYDKYGMPPIKQMIDDIKIQNLRGKLLFKRDGIEATIKSAAEFLERKKIEDMPEDSIQQKIDEIPF